MSSMKITREYLNALSRTNRVSLPDIGIDLDTDHADTAPSFPTIRREVKVPRISVDVAYAAFVDAWKEATA